jgi:UDP-N-acetyl-D-galactosamine dehydrogenase
VDIVSELESYGLKIDVYDPWVDPAEAEAEYGIRPIEALEQGAYHVIIIAVGHRQFAAMGMEDYRRLGVDKAVIYDVKHLLPADAVDGRL